MLQASWSPSTCPVENSGSQPPLDTGRAMLCYTIHDSLLPHVCCHRRTRKGAARSLQTAGHSCGRKVLELFTTMPAGVSWPQYLKMLSASLLSMFAGAELVHRYYRPDLV
ncbi:protein BRAWNIN isoform X1 [Rana temporaria]|uniref:protein BRAWNIN isoform X1 n=1 Tax=Rana temporaria TaxID=8407 RepID=UPI001AAD0FC8|nr:protein BRAWNIN isoform X1 [Rana temporaria]